MNIRELKRLQEEAYAIYTKVYSVDFTNEKEVLLFLLELHPYLNNINLTLPKEQLFQLLHRYGYGIECENMEEKSPVWKVIYNVMKDIEMEEFLQYVRTKYSKNAYSK